MQSFEYREPDSLEEALGLLQELGEDGKLVAGGTALIIMMNQRLLAPDCLISLRRIPGMDEIEEDGGNLRLGALATHRQLEVSPLLRSGMPALAETFRRVATIRIRNMATLGGSLAHADPSQDPPVTLLALNAAVQLASAGESRELPLEGFFSDYYETVLRPDEMLTGVTVPRPGPGSGTVYQKYLPRTAEDYATVGVAVHLTLEPDSDRCRECRIALGGVSPVPLLAREAGEFLVGKELERGLLEAAGEAAAEQTDPIDDVRGSADYKRAMAAVLVRRTVEQAWRQARP